MVDGSLRKCKLINRWLAPVAVSHWLRKSFSLILPAPFLPRVTKDIRKLEKEVKLFGE